MFNKIKNIYFKIINEFKDNIFNKVYKEYIEKGLNEYINIVKKYSKNFKEYNFLNSLYNFNYFN